jgi:cyclophilin family peptidyl-prolyl cis-trans isomerase
MRRDGARRLTASIVALAGLLLLAGCGGGGGGAKTDASGCTTVDAPAGAARRAPKPTAPLAPDKHYDVAFETNCGDFTVRLDQAQSPHAAASIVSLVQHEFFDDTIFHRIVVGFVIQGGDPTQSGNGGPGYQTVDKPPAGAAYSHGAVAMAKTGAEPAGTAGSQFFIVTETDAGLPPDYAIVGTVTKGLDVVDAIGRLGDANEQPTKVVEITKATVATS